VEAVHRAGDFVIEGGPLARMAPAARVDAESAERVRRAFLLGAQRTEEQDLEYAVRQLVEVALRALSPGINDPHTAMTCIDWLGDGIARLARCGMPPRLLRDGEGRVRLVTDEPSFAGVVDAAFNAIRQAAAANVAVSICLLETFGSLAPHLRRPFEFEAVRVHADRVLDTAGPATSVPSDREALAERHAAARAALAGAGAPA